MFSTKNRAGGSLLLAIIVVGLILMPHGMNQPVNAQVAESGLIRSAGYLSTGTCTRAGTYTQKFVRNPSAHSTYTTHWSPRLPELQFGFQITVDGFGYIQPSITYTVNGTSGNHTWIPLKVGSWGHRGALSLWAPYATRVTAYTGSDWTSGLDITVPDAWGTYNWSSSGTITLQAKYCKRTGPFWCEWEDVSSPGSESFSGSGSWTLAMTYVCPNCSQDVSHFGEHQVTCYGELTPKAYISGCGGKYWKCASDAKRRHSINPSTQSRPCMTSSSPTVQNNGGGTVSNNGGGTGTGSSSDRVRCGHSNCQRGGWASSREAHKTTCAAGHSYYACSLNGARLHANCRARGSGEVRCARGSWCRSGGWASSRNAHQITCAAGHTYWSCNPTMARRHRNCRS